MKQHVTSQEQILEKAMELALRDGLDAVSIRKLAAACNIAIGSVYNYYPNKDALIAATAEAFWNVIMQDQEKLYRKGMGFTVFLEQYYSFLYGRLVSYDRSWISKITGSRPEEKALLMLRDVLQEDKNVNQSIWNMELNEDAFLDYVMMTVMALLQAGENNCRFFLFLLEHLLYNA